MRAVRLTALVVAALLLRCVAATARESVVVGGTVVMKFVGDKKMTADKRAAVVQGNLDAALRRHKPASSIEAVETHGVYAIVWDGQPICTIDEAQARANDMSAKDLAFRWVKNLRAALKAGFVSVVPDSLVIALGSSKNVKVEGVAQGPIQVEADGIGIAASLSGDTVAIKGLSLGRYELHVTRDGVKVSVPIAVKESAGSIVEIPVQQCVTGNPATHDLLDEAVMLAVRGAVEAKPGATVSFKSNTAMPATLEPGASVTAHVAVSLEGPNYFTVSRIVDVVLKNEVIALQPPTLLMVSNRPEKVMGEGVLFRAHFGADQPTRLLYSHINGMGSTQYLWVNLNNPSDAIERVLVVQADGGPAPEELYVGHRCNTRFLEEFTHNQGVVVTLAPHHTYALGQYRMAPHQTVSGLAQLQLLAGDAVWVSVEASPDVEHVGHIENVWDAPFNPFRIHPKGTFGTPNVQISEKYVAGSADAAEIPFGKAPWLIDPSSGEPNTGNYGVMYEVRVDIENPTAQSQRVSLFFKPVNGVALGSFLIEGKLAETACVKPPDRCLISTVELAPQQNRSIRIVTLPQAGSHYPARIVIQTEQPEPSPTPPPPQPQETPSDTGGT